MEVKEGSRWRRRIRCSRSMEEVGKGDGKEERLKEQGDGGGKLASRGGEIRGGRSGGGAGR